MEKSKAKKWAFAVLKIGISLVAVIFIIKRIDIDHLFSTIHNASFPLLAIAIAFFIASKVVSAYRLNIYFANIDLKLSVVDNLKLYLLGMFYNLFLPGGIGGDGYKVWLLHKRGGGRMKQLAAAVLLDRVNGMYAIILLVLIAIPLVLYREWMLWLAPLVLVLSIVLYWATIRTFFRYFSKSITVTTLMSILVQLLQIISILCITKAIGIGDKYLELVLIFLVSSAVAVLPFTIGGVGARELVFLYGSLWWGIGQTESVTISFLFFIITAVVSFWGIIYSVGNIKLEINSKHG